jgi:hypothetical protein
MKFRTAVMFTVIALSVSVAAFAAESEHHKVPQHVSQNDNIKLQKTMRLRLQGIEEIIESLIAQKPQNIPGIVENKLRVPKDFKFPANLKRHNIDIQENNLAFHKSLDNFEEVLKEEDMKKSLAALHKVIQNCVACHANIKH